MIDRRTTAFSDDELAKAVEYVLRTNDFPPTVADVYRACEKFRRSVPKDRPAHRPGDVIHGEQTMTPEEAREELERLYLEKPEAFRDKGSSDTNVRLHTPAERKARLESTIDRIFISALRRCAALGADTRIVAPQQKTLF